MDLKTDTQIEGCSTLGLRARSSQWACVIWPTGLLMGLKIWQWGSGGSINYCTSAAKFPDLGRALKAKEPYPAC